MDNNDDSMKIDAKQESSIYYYTRHNDEYCWWQEYRGWFPPRVL